MNCDVCSKYTEPRNRPDGLVLCWRCAYRIARRPDEVSSSPVHRLGSRRRDIDRRFAQGGEVQVTEPTVRFVRTPVDGPITQEFGDMYSGYPHRGVDFGVVVGTTVYAPAAGKVVTPYNDGSFGIAVCLEHDGWYTLYAHLSRSNVSNGQTVRAEQIIGYSGNTGYSTGPHLHWQLSDSPSFPIDVAHSRDPMKYIHKEEEMTADERAKLDAVYAALTGGVPGVIEAWNANGNGMIPAYNEIVFPHINAGHGPGIPEHKHEPGKVAR